MRYKKIIIRLVKIFTLSIILYGCQNNIDTNYIKSTFWIYSDGYRIADFIKFDSTKLFVLHGDTILYKNIPKAVIVNYDKSNTNLIIKSLDKGQIGNYMDEIEIYGN